MYPLKRYFTVAAAGGRIEALRRDESGATAIEYALIAAAVALGIAVPVTQMGAKLLTTYTSLANGF